MYKIRSKSLSSKLQKLLYLVSQNKDVRADPVTAYDKIFTHTLPDRSVDHSCLIQALEKVFEESLNAEEVF